MSELPIKLLESYSTISVAKLNESLTVYLLVVNDSTIHTENFANLYVGVCKADKICPKGGQQHIFYALYKNHALFQTSSHFFRCLRVSSEILLGSTSFL